MSVVVTGHTGFIGRALFQALQQRQRRQTIGVSKSSGYDLMQPEWAGALGSIERIIHLAGFVGVENGWQKPRLAYEVNFQTTLNVLETARQGGAAVIFISSYVYGAPLRLPIDEKHPVRCGNPYARSKFMAEALCTAYQRDFGVPVTILRPFNIYGCNQGNESLIARVIQQALAGKAITVNDLRPKRDYLFIEDFVSAILKVLGSRQDGLEIYNLGAGKSFSVREIIDIVLRLVGKPLPVRSRKQFRPHEIMDCYSDSRKFSERFSWRPKFTLEDGIARMLRAAQASKRREK